MSRDSLETRHVYRDSIAVIQCPGAVRLLHFARVVDDAKCIVVTLVCVWLSAAACLHYCTDLDATWESDRGCPLFVHDWVDLRVALLWQHYANAKC